MNRQNMANLRRLVTHRPVSVRRDKAPAHAGARTAVVSLVLLLSLVLSALIVHVPPIYLIFGLGGLAFGWLLLFRIEVAAMLVLLLRGWLDQFNYLGGGTPLHPNGIMGVAIVLGAVYFFLFHKIDFSRLRAIGPYAAFLVVAAFSLLFAGEYRSEGVTVTLRLAAALAIYAILLYRLNSIRQIQWMVALIIAAQVWLTVSAMLRVGGQVDLSGAEIVRLGSSGMGAAQATYLMFCLVFLLESRGLRSRLIWGSLSAFFGLGLILSYGRGSWIAFLVTAALIGVVRYRKLLVILPVLVAIVVISVPSVTERFSDLSLDQLDDRYSSTLAQRFELWRAAIDLYGDHPLTGVGYGVARYRVSEMLGRYAWMIHNDYLMVLVSTGLIGFLVFAVWHGQWLVEILRVYRRARYRYDRTLAFAVFGVFVVLLVIRLSTNVVEDTDKLYPLSALVAATLSLPRVRARASDTIPDRMSLYGR